MSKELDDLFDLGEDFALCNRLFVRICEVHENRVDASAFTDEERTVYLVWGALGVIGNGGFRYLFESSIRGDPKYALIRQAFEEIGCGEAAEAFKQTLAAFPNSRRPARRSDYASTCGNFQRSPRRRIGRFSRHRTASGSASPTGCGRGRGRSGIWGRLLAPNQAQPRARVGSGSINGTPIGTRWNTLLPVA